jgi:hypothetical protein
MVQDWAIFGGSRLMVKPAPVKPGWGYGESGLAFPIDFDHALASIAAGMRAPLCIINRRLQQMAGLSQERAPVRPELAVCQRGRLSV